MSGQQAADGPTSLPCRQNRRLFFAFQLGLLFFDHASSTASRKAERLDAAERRGTLLQTVLKASFSLLGVLFWLRFTLVVFGLDIESLSTL